MAVKFVLRMSFCYLFSVHFLLARLATFAFRHRHNTVSGNTGRFSAPRNKNHNMLNNLVKLTRFLHLHFCVANNDSSRVKSKQLSLKFSINLKKKITFSLTHHWCHLPHDHLELWTLFGWHFRASECFRRRCFQDLWCRRWRSVWRHSSFK